MSVNIIITKTSTTKLTSSHSPGWVHLEVTFLGFEDKNVKKIVFSFKRPAVQLRTWNTPFHFCSTKPLGYASPHHGSDADSFQSQTPASRILGASFCPLGIGSDLRLEKNACILLNSRQAVWEIGKTKNKKRLLRRMLSQCCVWACLCVCVCVWKLTPSSAHYSHPASSSLSPSSEWLGLCQGVTIQTNSFASHVGIQNGHLGFVFAWERS